MFLISDIYLLIYKVVIRKSKYNNKEINNNNFNIYIIKNSFV
jgi:hypothetical protein